MSRERAVLETVSLRRFPYPHRAHLALCSDRPTERHHSVASARVPSPVVALDASGLEQRRKAQLGDLNRVESCAFPEVVGDEIEREPVLCSRVCTHSTDDDVVASDRLAMNHPQSAPDPQPSSTMSAPGAS